MSDFVAPEEASLLHEQGLDTFEALWNLPLVPVDEPNVRGKGISTVYRLCIGERSYFLKRQSNYLTRTLRHPLKGETTLAREFRNIRLYRQRGIPALHAAFFGERNLPGERQALLLTPALDGWLDLHHYLLEWPELAEAERQDVLGTCGRLIRTLHSQGQKHSCLYPKHVFLRRQAGSMQACLIDLEKTRPLLPIRMDRVADIETLVRRAAAWDERCIRHLLASYLDVDGSDARIDDWLQRLARRRADKESRG
ncbi:lipopolysaccharide kinase [Stutzerimonas kirkiae]|uniref:Lipopolysaccharide kinase n=1 Tax=Stutzerimonas kirkiae TaxID=2211392 RepID=A0A4Q9R5G8_9GAMM|nr:lipopolysaccharide kinase InaA family protein [Stutzerimonas kirkiae]TBU95727.1 lipopolysaccharide kinase [Stutzerimonas kirkiae]TBV02718.1 lipopolysaccharide kinase [Stutzerimonas kirkiae]